MRARGRRPRVLVGTFEISGLVGDLADGLRQAGCETTIALSWRDPLLPERRGTLHCGEDLRSVDWRRLSARLRAGLVTVPSSLSRCRTPEQRVGWLITRHDVFVFVHASLWHDRHPTRPSRVGAGREYPLLKALGKRIVSVFSGPDVRHASAYDQQNAALGARAYPMGSIGRRWGRTPVSYPLRSLRRAELFADLVLSQPNQSGLALRPYHHLTVPIDLARYRCWIPRREVPVVVHAPSVAKTKGTDLLLAALGRLAARGVGFELRLLHDAPNDRLREELTDADVLIDQLHLPLHGKLGAEAMASGCALATCDREAFEPYPPRRPVWHLEPESLETRLERLLLDRELRIRLAREGRRHVERHHGHVAVAQGLLRLLDGEPHGHLHVPEFFARSYCLPNGSRIPRALLRMTRRVVERWGLPAGVGPEDLVARGLLAPAKGPG